MPSPTPLNGRQRRHLRALAHHLEPLVQVGKEGVTDAVVAAADQALTDHELIKIRLPQIDRDERGQMALELERGTRAAIAGTTGRVVLLYRRHPNEPVIQLPR
jgi:RNA-binding protein